MQEHYFDQKEIFSKLSKRCGNIKTSCERYFLRVNPNNITVYGIFYVLVEEREVIEYSGNVVANASLNIKYSIGSFNRYSMQRIKSHQSFDASYTNISKNDSVSLTGSAVFLDPQEYRGHKIGTYLMNTVVKWVQGFDDKPVNPIELLSLQAQDENKERRNRFYEQFGIMFDYDEQRENGISKPILTHDLIQVNNWKNNITKLTIIDILKDLDVANETIGSLEQCIKSDKEIIDEATDYPIFWAIKAYLFKLRLFLGI